MIYPVIHFGEQGNERAISESRSRGYYSEAIVEVDAGIFYSVFFYDPVRIVQDLQTQIDGVKEGGGRPFSAETAMIVIPEVTESNMRSAIQDLFNDGWFETFRPRNT